MDLSLLRPIVAAILLLASAASGEEAGTVRHVDERTGTVVVTEGIHEGDRFISGTMTTFYPGGSKADVTHYLNRKKNGPTTSWRTNGKIELEGSYTEGRATGIWVWYKPDGTVDRRVTYAIEGQALTEQPAPTAERSP